MIDINDLPGEPIDPSFFSEFTVVEVMEEVDFPLLLRVHAGDGSPWLFNWCDSDRGAGGTNAASSHRETWVAFRVSPERLTRVLDGRVSLRQAMVLPEYPMYILQGKDAIHPDVARHVHPLSLPSAYFPADDDPLDGGPEPYWPTTVEDNRLLISTIGVPGESGGRDIPIAVSNSISEALQRYLTWLPTSERQVSGQLFNEASTLDLVVSTSGSIKVTCKTSKAKSADPQTVAGALGRLRGLLEPVAMGGENPTGPPMPEQAIQAVLDLLRTIDSTGFSLFIKWKGREGKEEFLAISHGELERVVSRLDAVYAAPKEDIVSTRSWVTVQLTNEEMGILLNETGTEGSGGYQSLISGLQGEQLDRKNGLLRLNPEQVRRIIRYVQDYGGGGWQDQLRPVYLALHRLGVSFAGFR